MKAILMCVDMPEGELIFRGEKTDLVRKTAPRLETPFRVYMYQTKYKWRNIIVDVLNAVYGGGKVIGTFVCDEIDEYIYDYCTHP